MTEKIGTSLIDKLATVSTLKKQPIDEPSYNIETSKSLTQTEEEQVIILVAKGNSRASSPIKDQQPKQRAETQYSRKDNEEVKSDKSIIVTT